LKNVIVVDWPEKAFHQSQTMTKALYYVQTAVFADLVFFLDADEFLGVNDSSDLKKAFADIPIGTCALLPWKNFIPNPALGEDGIFDPLRSMNLFRKNEKKQIYKAVVRLGGQVDSTLKVSQGNHMVSRRFGRKLPAKIVHQVPLFHFPLRSIDQMLVKGVLGWKANLLRAKYLPYRKEALHWKKIFEIYTSGSKPSDESLISAALSYGETGERGNLPYEVSKFEHGISYRRAYSDGKFGSAEKLLCDATSEQEKIKRAKFVAPSRPFRYGGKSNIPHSFDSAWHWDNVYIDVAPIRFMIESLQPQSILDLGCGNGVYPLLYRHLGVSDFLGVDGFELEATVLDNVHYKKVDLHEPFSAGRQFDLVVCLEVVEHLKPAATGTIFKTIADHVTSNGNILFSMAEPGQPGNGHVNCRDIAEVLAAWKKLGWEPDVPRSLGLRAISSLQWFRRNLLLLRKSGDQKRLLNAECLEDIGTLRFSWRNQRPGIRQNAFSERYPRYRLGNGTADLGKYF
ncbi:MAG: methyltransferase domain-containing protein, partial [Alphaproteobacteria bacterium]|nr:methyltransferase domain-containing protein [Alphaproteobacteria bacterium]